MDAQLFVALFIAAVLAVYLVIAVRTWIRVRGTRVVVCPETQKPVAVRVDVGHAIASAVREKADLKLTSCSRWPESQDCDQPCVRQIEAAPVETRPKAIAAHFFGRQRCAICSHPIGTPSSLTLQPGFMDPATHQVYAWNDVPPQDLSRAIAAWRPLCPDCTLAESFRHDSPERVTDRERHE